MLYNHVVKTASVVRYIEANSQLLSSKDPDSDY